MPLTRNVARAVLASLLARDLAYGAPIVDEALASSLSTRFVELFPAGSHFMTNGTLAQHHANTNQDGAGWTPVTGATFDTGVVAVSASRMGWFWVEDED
jgi:hypothetical protein